MFNVVSFLFLFASVCLLAISFFILVSIMVSASGIGSKLRAAAHALFRRLRDLCERLNVFGKEGRLSRSMSCPSPLDILVGLVASAMIKHSLTAPVEELQDFGNLSSWEWREKRILLLRDVRPVLFTYDSAPTEVVTWLLYYKGDNMRLSKRQQRLFARAWKRASINSASRKALAVEFAKESKALDAIEHIVVGEDSRDNA